MQEKRKYWMLYSRRCGSSSAAVPAVWIRQSLVLWPGREREELRIHPWYNSFYSLIKSSWCNSLFSSNHPGAIHPILQIILVQFIMFFKSSFSLNHPGAIHPFLQVILVQFVLFFKSSWFNSSFSLNHPGAINPILKIVHVKKIARQGTA